MYNVLGDNPARTQYVSEQLAFNEMNLVAGQNRTRKLGSISSGTAEYTELSNDIIISLDCRQAGKIMNLENSYLVVDITNYNNNIVYLPGKIGTLGLISEMTVQTNSGVQFSYFRDQNVLQAIEICKRVDTQYLSSWGNALFGTAIDDMKGTSFAAATLGVPATAALGGTRTLIIPFSLSNFFKSVIPMWGEEQIQIRIKLADPRLAYVSTAITVGSMGYSNLKFVYETVDIPPEIFNKFVTAKNNTYTISGKDWYSVSASIPATNTGIQIQIPIQRACVSKVIACLRTTANLSDPTKNALCSRNRGGYTESYLIYNGQSYPLLTVASSVTSVAEQLAEMMINNGNHLLNIPSSFINESNVVITSPAAAGAGACAVTSSGNKFLADLATGVDAANSGYAFYEFYLGNSLENDDTTYSGLQVSNSTLSLVLGKGVGVAVAQTVNIFVEFQSKYTLSNGMWKVEY